MLGNIVKRLFGEKACEGRHRGVCVHDMEGEIAICGTGDSSCEYANVLETPIQYLVDGNRTPLCERKGTAHLSCSYQS